MEESNKEENQQVLRVLELLKQASHELQNNPSPQLTESNSSSSAIKALLELETESDTILSDPSLTQLSEHLAYLKDLVQTFQSTRGHGLRSFLRRRVSTHEIARVAESIEFEIQSWIDRESIENLVMKLHGVPSESDNSGEEGELTQLLTQFKNRVSQGFSLELQDLVLKSKIFTELETILCDPTRAMNLRTQAALTIESLIRFNKNVFVGQVLMGPTIKALISMSSSSSSSSSLRVVISLIKSIKSPLVDEIDSNNDIPTIIGILDSDDTVIKELGFDCILEIGYYGRKEAIEAMIKEGVVEKLVELQRSKLGGDLIDISKTEWNRSTEKYMVKNPFASCVARLAVQIEVGEGLRQREKRMFKQEFLKRVGDASLNDAQAATIQAEVLWGASPY